jgi:hypothetical protein
MKRKRPTRRSVAASIGRSATPATRLSHASRPGRRSSSRSRRASAIWPRTRASSFDLAARITRRAPSVGITRAPTTKMRGTRNMAKTERIASALTAAGGAMRTGKPIALTMSQRSASRDALRVSGRKPERSRRFARARSDVSCESRAAAPTPQPTTLKTAISTVNSRRPRKMATPPVGGRSRAPKAKPITPMKKRNPTAAPSHRARGETARASRRSVSRAGPSAPRMGASARASRSTPRTKEVNAMGTHANQAA